MLKRDQKVRVTMLLTWLEHKIFEKKQQVLRLQWKKARLERELELLKKVKSQNNKERE